MRRRTSFRNNTANYYATAAADETGDEMKSIKYRKWRLSKRKFPTREIYGQNGRGSGSLVIGRTKAADKLSETLGRSRVDAMTIRDTRTEWVFLETK